MNSAFAIVVVVVVVVAAVAAILTSLSSGGLYDRIGRGGLSLDMPDGGRAPAAGSAAARAEADEEIRQLVEAKSARRVARGEAALDVEAEIAALTAEHVAGAGADAELREEVRQLVVARNSRRIARGQEPVDVDSEVERQLRDLDA